MQQAVEHEAAIALNFFDYNVRVVRPRPDV